MNRVLAMALTVVSAVLLGACSEESLSVGHEPPDSSGGGVESGAADSSADSSTTLDGASDADAGRAVFEFLINDVVQHPLSCPTQNWRFPPFFPNPDGGADGGVVVCNPTPPCAGVTSVVLHNTGPVSVAYHARPAWNLGVHYIPGVLTGAGPELAGVLDPGAKVDIASAFAGGTTALLGSSAPFSDQDKNLFDEGTIPWPKNVGGSDGASVMHVAEITIARGCEVYAPVW